MSTTHFSRYLFAVQLLGPATIALLGVLGMPAEAAGFAFVLLGFGMMVAVGRREELRASILMLLLALYTLAGLGLSLAHLDHWGASMSEYTLLDLPASYAHRGVEVLYLAAVLLTLARVIQTRTPARDGAGSKQVA